MGTNSAGPSGSSVPSGRAVVGQVAHAVISYSGGASSVAVEKSGSTFHTVFAPASATSAYPSGETSSSSSTYRTAYGLESICAPSGLSSSSAACRSAYASRYSSPFSSVPATSIDAPRASNTDRSSRSGS